MAKIKPYKYVNPNTIKVVKSPMVGVKSSMVGSGVKAREVSARKGGNIDTENYTRGSRKTLLGLNRIGSSVYSVGIAFDGLSKILLSKKALIKKSSAFDKKAAQFKKDQESEKLTEGKKKGAVEKTVDEKDVKKEGKKELSWIEKLLGPFKGIIEFATKTIITQGVLRWIANPANGGRLEKIVGALKTYFGWVFNVAMFAVDKFLTGVSMIFGDGSKQGFARFAEVLGGLGTLLLGIVGFKALGMMLNPFKLASGIVSLLNILAGLVNRQQTAETVTDVVETADDVVDATKKADDVADAAKAADAATDAAKAVDKVDDAIEAVDAATDAAKAAKVPWWKKLQQGAAEKLAKAKQFGSNLKGKFFAGLDWIKKAGAEKFKQGKDLFGKAGAWAKQNVNMKTLKKVAMEAAEKMNPANLVDFVKTNIGTTVKDKIKDHKLVKRLYDVIKNPKQLGPLIKDALKSKEAFDTRKYLKSVQQNAKIGGIDKVIAAITALLDYGIAGTPFLNAFLGATGGLLGYSGGFALGAPFGGVPGFVAGAAGGIVGEIAGRELAKLLAKTTPLGEMQDPIFPDRMLAGTGEADEDEEDPTDPTTSDAPRAFLGGIFRKPTEVVVGERGPEVLLPMKDFAQQSGGAYDAIASDMVAATRGTMAALGASGEAATKLVDRDLDKLSEGLGSVGKVQPGSLGGQTTEKKFSAGGPVAPPPPIETLVGKDTSSPNTLRGQFSRILDSFVNIIKNVTGQKKDGSSSPDTGSGGGTPDTPNLGNAGAGAASTKDPNAKAVLNALADAEGTSKYPNQGYNTQYTGKQFKGVQHPREVLGRSLRSDAAGRYQFLSTTWDWIMGGDMTPERQDKAALKLIANRGVDLSDGLSAAEVYRLGGEWASVEGGPQMKKGGGYGGQAKFSAEKFLSMYEGYGGTVQKMAAGGKLIGRQGAVPGPAVKKLQPVHTHTAKTSGGTLQIASAAVAFAEEQQKEKMQVVPIPMPVQINNTAPAAPAPQPVIRARQTITRAF